MWPSSSGTIPTNQQGTTLLADATDDHSLSHRQLGSLANSFANTLGTTGGTNLLRNAISPGDQVFALNLGGTAYQTVTKGTFNNSIIGTPAVNGGTIGTILMQGGTIAGAVGTATTNNLVANWLSVSNGTSINIGSASAPTANQVLTAVNGSAATWQTPSSVNFYASGTLAPGTTASASGVDLPNCLGTISAASPSKAVKAQVIVKGDWYNGTASGNSELWLVVNGGTIDYLIVAPIAINNRQSFCLSGTAAMGAGTAGTVKLQGDASNGTLTVDQVQFTAVYG